MREREREGATALTSLLFLRLFLSSSLDVEDEYESESDEDECFRFLCRRFRSLSFLSPLSFFSFLSALFLLDEDLDFSLRSLRRLRLRSSALESVLYAHHTRA
jgi:hypothetical protein